MVRPTNQQILTLHHPPIHKSSEQKLSTGGVQSTYNVNQSFYSFTGTKWPVTFGLIHHIPEANLQRTHQGKQ